MFFSLFELIPAFICASNTESLVNNLFGVNICNPFPSFTSSSLSSGVSTNFFGFASSNFV